MGQKTVNDHSPLSMGVQLVGNGARTFARSHDQDSAKIVPLGSQVVEEFLQDDPYEDQEDDIDKTEEQHEQTTDLGDPEEVADQDQ